MSYIVAGVSAAITIGAAYQQSQSIEANAEFQKATSELNAEMAEIDGHIQYRQGISQVVKAQGQIDQAKDAQLAVVASTGAEVTGSLANLITESNINSSLNLLDMEQEAMMKRLSFGREAEQRRLQGEISYREGKTNAKNTLLSGYANASQIGFNSYAKAKGKV